MVLKKLLQEDDLISRKRLVFLLIFTLYPCNSILNLKRIVWTLKMVDNYDEIRTTRTYAEKYNLRLSGCFAIVNIHF